MRTVLAGTAVFGIQQPRATTSYGSLIRKVSILDVDVNAIKVSPTNQSPS